jgi:5'-deoxynucleotidase
MTTISHFFAYISRLRWIKRWSLMRNAIHEDVAVHSWEVATFAHVLAVIHKQQNPTSDIDPYRMATIALYHDATEVYQGVEQKAQHELLALLPISIQNDFKAVLIEEDLPEEYKILLKAADRLSALLKCRAELRAGNQEFSQAEEIVHTRLLEMSRPEVSYFLDVFAPSYDKTLDNLLER